VGDRIRSRLDDLALPLEQAFTLPSSIDAITTLVTEILQEIHLQQQDNHLQEVYLFFNQTLAKSQYEPTFQRILPLDNVWQQDFLSESWPTSSRPQLLAPLKDTFSALIGEYLFTSLFRACIESLASENASRLIAMQRAEKNIEEIQTQLLRQYHRQRQSAIDEELSDLVGGFEALTVSPD
jgi:F-type H+-transporting ATPase subunit gamma